MAVAQSPQPQVRMRWQDFIKGPDGTKRLASLQKAVAKMKSLDSSPTNSADYHRSWQFWANIHGYYGPTSTDGTVEDQISYLKSNGFNQYVKYYNGIKDQPAPDSVAQSIWATCEHSYTDQQGNLHQANFFGWHRMYLYYFERVLRWAAQDDTLRLPYWDYTDPKQEILPAEFRKTSSPIYDVKRNPRVNNGNAALNPTATDIDNFLTNKDYLPAELSVEEGVHGYVHCTVGPTCPVAYMGDVPVAGNDPVFYSHHANIDRLWACWQQIHGSKPTGASWEDQTFSFVDETGTLQTRPVKDFLDAATLGYVYDNVSDCARTQVVTAAAPVAQLAAAGPSDKTEPSTLGSVGNVAITKPTTTVDLTVPHQAMTNALTAPHAAGSVELVLHDVAADTPPGTLFNVYLAVKGDPAKRQQIGTISWFGAFNNHHASHGTVQKRTYTFNATDALHALGSGAGTAGVQVVLEASDGLVSTSGAAVTAHAQTEQAFRPDANMRIGSMELRAVPASGTNP
jgi:Common central domain of tyrosinase/Polyphenol oxidase middle domain